MNTIQTSREAGDATSIRRLHLSHEANLKSFGLLYYIGAMLCFLMSSVLIYMLVFMKAGKTSMDAYLPIFMLGMSIFLFWIGRGLRTLNREIKIPAGILAAIGLIGVPLGTLINGYLLYLLFSEKGTMVFSDQYRQVIADTPDIKYRTSIIVWIFLALLVMAPLIGIVVAVAQH